MGVVGVIDDVNDILCLTTQPAPVTGPPASALLIGFSAGKTLLKPASAGATVACASAAEVPSSVAAAIAAKVNQDVLGIGLSLEVWGG